MRIASVILVGLVGLVLCATDGISGGKPSAKGMLPANWKKLGLGKDQVDKIYKIQADFDAKLDDLQKQIKKLRDDEHKELLLVLTDPQREQLKKILLEKSGLSPEKKETKSEDKK